MIPNTLTLGTRGSPLALWQANYVAARLQAGLPHCQVRLQILETHGDRDRATALSAMGGFGVFTKVIQDAVLEQRADLAVHSLKDLPTIPTAGLQLAAVPERGPTGDAFVSVRHRRFDDLPHGAIVGTSSLRRQAQVRHRRPDLQLVPLRGNVETRLRKLDDGAMDAIILADAGLVRLNHGTRITEILDRDWMLPAVGQGALGLECRTADTGTFAALELLQDLPTTQAVLAERAMLAALGGGCLIPVGVDTSVENGQLTLRGAVLAPDGSRRIVATHTGPAQTPLAVGQELAALLVQEGAEEILVRIGTP